MQLMDVIARVIDKRVRLDAGAGEQRRTRQEWIALMTERFGMLAQAHNKGCSDAEFADGAMDVAAIAVALAEAEVYGDN